MIHQLMLHTYCLCYNTGSRCCHCSIMSLQINRFILKSNRLNVVTELQLDRRTTRLATTVINHLHTHNRGYLHSTVHGIWQNIHNMELWRYPPRCHGLSVYPVWVCNKVRLPAHFRSHFESSTVYKSTYFDYLRTSFKANVKCVVRKRNVWKRVLNKDD